MSSVSARNSFGNSPDFDGKKRIKRITSPLVGNDTEDVSLRLCLSRTNSESSLFSHISSVSEHYEKINKLEELQASEKAKRSTIRRRAPVSTKSKEVLPQQRLMDDNELSIKKASEEAASIKNTDGKVSLKRRNSDMSSSSSASNASSSLATARLKANLQQLPPTLGTNDQEIRLTRSKLKTLIEQPTAKASSTLRSTKNKRLDIVEENEDGPSPAKMSINNLLKHNAAMNFIVDEPDSQPGLGNNAK